MIMRKSWVNIAVCPCLQSSLTHHRYINPFENKVWAIHIFMKKCVGLFIKFRHLCLIMFPLIYVCGYITLEPHNRVQFSVISRTLVDGRVSSSSVGVQSAYSTAPAQRAMIGKRQTSRLLLVIWNYFIACKLLVLDKNTWNHIVMCKQMLCNLVIKNDHFKPSK